MAITVKTTQRGSFSLRSLTKATAKGKNARKSAKKSANRSRNIKFNAVFQGSDKHLGPTGKILGNGEVLQYFRDIAAESKLDTLEQIAAKAVRYYRSRCIDPKVYAIEITLDDGTSPVTAYWRQSGNSHVNADRM